MFKISGGSCGMGIGSEGGVKAYVVMLKNGCSKDAITPQAHTPHPYPTKDHLMCVADVGLTACSLQPAVLHTTPHISLHSPPLRPPPPIADFGLCELLSAERTHVSNHEKGTPFYMAPETILQHQVGARVWIPARVCVFVCPPARPHACVSLCHHHTPTCARACVSPCIRVLVGHTCTGWRWGRCMWCVCGGGGGGECGRRGDGCTCVWGGQGVGV